MNNRDITRYEMLQRYDVDSHGEIPLSYGRYVRWEDFLEVVEEMQTRIYALEEDADDLASYDDGYSDGYADCEREHGD